MSTKIRPDRKAHSFTHLLPHAFSLARSLSVGSLVVQTDRKSVIKAVSAQRTSERVIWLMHRGDALADSVAKQDVVIDMPALKSTGMHLLRLGLFLATMNGRLSADERVVCLFRTSDANRPDTLLVTHTERYFPWVRDIDPAKIRAVVAPSIFARVLEIARRFADEGREGKPIGTIFVLGHPKELEPHLRQLMLNPCHGHPRAARKILNPDFLETLRELSALDGALIISDKGHVESAGTYISAPQGATRVAPGLGARHQAAAAVSSTGKAVAVVISESSGTITVFLQGTAVLQLTR
jgi:DNA integrity scanning protein DisA with diadenylate cyclase activity